jgi:hypothetical protein
MMANGFIAILEAVAKHVPPAYIDPSSGGMLFQLLAVLFTVFSRFVLFFSRQIKSTFARVKRFFSDRFNQD